MKKVVYINDRRLLFANVYDKLETMVDGGAVLNDEQVSVAEVIRKLESGEEKSIVYLSSNEEESWKSFISNFVLIEAAGGLVENEQGEKLFIFRNGKWDLPKGKAEYDETPDVTALREVEEECGLKNLKIKSETKKTYHTYHEEERSILKVTHWYKMEAEGNQDLVPQEEEGITKVAWLNEEEIRSVVFSNTYSSIRELLTIEGREL